MSNKYNKKSGKPTKTASPQGGADPSPKKVGYKSPPEHTRFKKGQSGNPSGRPKVVKSFAMEVCEIADEDIEINTKNGKQITSVRHAMARKSCEMALKGNINYMKLYIQLEEMAQKQQEVKEENRYAKQAAAMQDLLGAFLYASIPKEERDRIREKNDLEEEEFYSGNELDDLGDEA